MDLDFTGQNRSGTLWTATHVSMSLSTRSGSDQDLYEAGMSSQANVQVLIALEEEFEIEFPESMLERSTFCSVVAMREAVQSLLSERA